MQFTAQTPRNASGWSYGAFNQEVGVWNLASFYPVLARRANGQWDQRSVVGQGDVAVTDTALYDVTLDVPPAWSLATTGVRIDQMPLDHGPRRERFVSGPQRDFFIAATQLERASTDVDGTRVVVYYQADDVIGGQRSLQVAADSLRVFNDRFGPYPLAEVEVVQAALTRFLGVEYPGIVLIEQSIYSPGDRLFDTTVAHEIAHQWWYSLVGNDVQGEPWLDEGLTSYTQVLYYEGIGNNQAAQGELDYFRAQYGYLRNANRDGPVGGPVDSFGGNYFPLVYMKGALFFHAMRQQMGEEAFFGFLQNYYASYRYEEPTGPDMLRVAQETCGCDLQPLYDAWIHGAGPVQMP
jgi:aminopeptidase N